jgi:hypothetical protein
MNNLPTMGDMENMDSMIGEMIPNEFKKFKGTKERYGLTAEVSCDIKSGSKQDWGLTIQSTKCKYGPF